MMPGASDLRFMAFPVMHAVIAAVIALMFRNEGDYVAFLLKAWICWVPAFWFLFGSRTKLWFLPLVASIPFLMLTAWFAWGKQ